MKNIPHLLTFIFILLTTSSTFGQEWKNLNSYQLITGKNNIEKGNWLKKDRLKNTVIWQNANRFNLSIEEGNTKYQSISEIRDLYKWIDSERTLMGHEVIAFGVAAIVAEQLSNFDNGFVRNIIVHNKEVVNFGNDGSKRVLAYFYPFIQKVYFSTHIYKGEEAKALDKKIGKIEQCGIVDPIYQNMSPKGIKILTRMAKGKGIYRLKVKKELRFEGDIKDCEARYNHAFTKLYDYYYNLKK